VINQRRTTSASWRGLTTTPGRSERRKLHVVVGVEHFLHLELPSAIAQRILAG
jgi:hypothetical protein